LKETEIAVGFTSPFVEFLAQSRCDGVRFGRTLTLGRQDLLVSPLRVEAALRDSGCWPSGLDRREFLDALCQKQYYADPFLRALGATEVSSLDASPFEGAGIIHDLNEPILEEHHGQYDAVIDGGLLEHIFNFPVALKSCMEMVKVGGTLLIHTPANNYFGHGFYQFSPELFFRAFSRENGYRLDRIVALENDLKHSRFIDRKYTSEWAGRSYDVTDPDGLGRRGLLVGRRPVVLHIRATRVRQAPIFARPPQQSDYAAAWRRHEEPGVDLAPRLARFPKSLLKRFMTQCGRLHLEYHLIGLILRSIDPTHFAREYRKRSFRDRRAFRPVESKPVALGGHPR
jgi:SAM-dependent methyltransferase